jgi:hypothetical protein
VQLTIPAYDVILDTPAGRTTHRLEVLHADQLHAEQAGPRHGLVDRRQQGMEFATLLAWSSARRTGVFPGEYPEFRAQCLLLQAVEEEELTTVDPTNPGPGPGSPSASPATSEEDPSSGSTPTET